MEPRTDMIRAYYGALDRCDVEEALSVFSSGISYLRGTRTFNGIDAVRDFYEHARRERIMWGTHELASITEDGNTVTVVGALDGMLAGDRKARVAFTDNFTFEGEQVARRVTTFPGEEI
jgi:ketosteroid isomerase-like protein